MSIIKNYFFYSFNRILKILISVVSVPYVSRVLGAKNVGIYSYTYTVASYFVMFVILGLDNYGNREIAKNRNNKLELNRVASEIYFLQILMGIVVFCVYIFYCILTLEEYALFFKIQGLYVLSSLIDVNWLLSGLEEFKFTSIRNSIINVLSFILIIILVRDSHDLELYMLILSSVAVVNNIIGWLYVVRNIKLEKVSFYGIFRHLKPNLVLFIPIVAVSLYKMMDKIMMGVMNDMTQVGYYESAEKIIQIPTLLISSLGVVMLPRMSNLYHIGGKNEATVYMKYSIDFGMVLATSICFGIMGISKEFVPLFYGPGFNLCTILYLILLPCCIFLAFSNVIRTQYLIPMGFDRIYIIGVVGGALANLCLNVILIPKMGAVGAAIGTLFAEAVVCIVQSYCVKNKIPIKIYAYRCIPFMLLGITMFLFLYNLHIGTSILVNMIIKIIIGILYYCIGLLLILKCCKIYDLENTLNLFKFKIGKRQ